MRLILIIPLILLIVVPVLSQEQTVLYNLGNDRNILPLEVIREKMDRIQSMLEGDSLKWVVRLEDLHREVRNDTLIHHVTIHVIERSVLEKEQVTVGLEDYLPDFSFPTLARDTLTASDLLGKVTLINCWFTRCPPCIAEMPYLNQLRDDYQGRRIRFLSMAPESAEEIRSFLRRYDFSFDHLPGAEEYIEQFGTGYPKNILIDHRGVIRYIGGGLVEGIIEPGDEGLVTPDRVNVEGLRVKIEELLEEAGG